MYEDNELSSLTWAYPHTASIN